MKHIHIVEDANVRPNGDHIEPVDRLSLSTVFKRQVANNAVGWAARRHIINVENTVALSVQRKGDASLVLRRVIVIIHELLIVVIGGDGNDIRGRSHAASAPVFSGGEAGGRDRRQQRVLILHGGKTRRGRRRESGGGN